MSQCSVCTSQKIRKTSAMHILRHKGQRTSISVAFSVCLDCNFEFVGTDQEVQKNAVIRIKKAAIDKQAA